MITIRKALPGEGANVARRIRASLPDSIEGLTIWHCRQVDRWVETHLDAPGPSVFYVAVNERGETIAAAEFRTIGNTAFLNQIGVSPSRQGEGVGRRLLAAGLHGLSQSGEVETVALDVERNNRRASEWYRRLGLLPFSQSYWTLLPLRPGCASPAAVQGWEKAENEHARFGFAQFHVQGNNGRYPAGLLGGKLFRLTSGEAWRDAAVHSALAHLDPNRRLLLISPAPPGNASPVRHSERLTGPIGRALAKLSPP